MGNGVGIQEGIVVSPGISKFITDNNIQEKDFARYHRLYVDLLVNECLTEEEIVERLQKKLVSSHSAPSIVYTTVSFHTDQILTSKYEIEAAHLPHNGKSQTALANIISDKDFSKVSHVNSPSKTNSKIKDSAEPRALIKQPSSSTLNHHRECHSHTIQSAAGMHHSSPHPLVRDSSSFVNKPLEASSNESHLVRTHTLDGVESHLVRAHTVDGVDSHLHKLAHVEYRCHECDIGFSTAEMLEHHFRYSKAHMNELNQDSHLTSHAHHQHHDNSTDNASHAENSHHEGRVHVEVGSDTHPHCRSASPPLAHVSFSRQSSACLTAGSSGSSAYQSPLHHASFSGVMRPTTNPCTKDATAAITALAAAHHVPMTGAEKVKLRNDIMSTVASLSDYYVQHLTQFHRSKHNLWYACRKLMAIPPDHGEYKEIFIYEVDSPPKIDGHSFGIVLEAVVVKSENNVYGKVYLPYEHILRLLSDDIARASLEQRVEFATHCSQSSQLTERIGSDVHWEEDVSRKFVVQFILDHLYIFHDTLRQVLNVGFRMGMLNAGSRIEMMLGSNANGHSVVIESS